MLGGRSFVEQAAITGEAIPVEKLAGDPVYAGTINQSGALEVRADKLGRDTTCGKIIEAVERAEKSSADSEDGRSLGRLPRVLRLGSRSSDFHHHSQS